MSLFDLDQSLERARGRLTGRAKGLGRSDRGESRMPKPVARALRRMLSGYQRPSVSILLQRLRLVCQRSGHPTPSRATVYQFMSKTPIHFYDPKKMSPDVRATLYNLGDEHPVPGHQLVLHCFQYGSLASISFAAGLPWIDLYQAQRTRGWRARSRGLLGAIIRTRKI